MTAEVSKYAFSASGRRRDRIRAMLPEHDRASRGLQRRVAGVTRPQRTDAGHEADRRRLDEFDYVR